MSKEWSKVITNDLRNPITKSEKLWLNFTLEKMTVEILRKQKTLNQ